MIHLRLLGGVGLERDGEVVTGRATHRHPLALLALLAAAPAGSVGRDKLVARLWPEDDARKARHRLSVGLHSIRKALGAGCVISQGDSLTLDPDEVQTDVRAFTTAVAEGRLADAVALYGGPFLDGFFLGGSVDFDHWVEAERARLAALHEQALEQLAREASARDDPSAAAHYWKRLGRLRPLSGRTALDVARGLVEAGDRIGALRHLRAHMARVTTELEVDPAPETVGLADRLAAELPRTVPPPGAGPSAHGVEDASGSEPGNGAGAPDPSLWRRPVALTLAAAAALGAILLAAFLRPSPEATARPTDRQVVVAPFDATGYVAGDGEIGPMLARDVAGILAWVPGMEATTEGGGGSEATIRGAVTHDSAVLVVNVVLLEAGNVTWSGRYDASDGEPEAIREEVSLAIAHDVRGRLVPFEPKKYTESEWAYERFLQGVWVHRRSGAADLWKALQYYREAREEDPAFALAHAISANAYMGLARTGMDPGIPYEHARREALRSLEIDSTLAEGHVALAVVQLWRDWDFEAAAGSIRRAIVLNPTLPQAWTVWGGYLLRVRDRPAAAIRSYRRGLEVDPLNGGRSPGLERTLYYARRFGEVLEQHDVTRSLSPDLEFTFGGSPLADALRELGRYDDAEAAYRRLRELRPDRAPTGLAVLYARTGRIDEAREILRRLEEGVAESPAAGVHVAAVHAALGEPDRAMERLERAFEVRAAGLLSIGVDPVYDPLRPDPRFQELLRRIGLPSGTTAPAPPPAPRPGA